MVTTAAPRRTSIYRPGRIRRASHEELQAPLDAADAALPAAIERAHPVVPFGWSYNEIERMHPNRSVALFPTRVDEHGSDREGRVLAVAETRGALDAEVARLRGVHPNLHVLTWYAGRQPLPDGVAVG